EALTWNRLVHPNLLPFYGVFLPGGDIERVSFISPWMENGHVNQYLQRHPNADRGKLATGIIMGLAYLHRPSVAVIHGDLQPSNILVTSTGTAFIAGFSPDPLRHLAASAADAPHSGGTYPYQAPESLLKDEPVTMAAISTPLGVRYGRYSIIPMPGYVRLGTNMIANTRIDLFGTATVSWPWYCWSDHGTSEQATASLSKPG
ncbi:kinase-like domain-containing protein, partial [Hygrophoropsis aurantiaca]